MSHHIPCFRGACENNAHPACWNAMTGGVYCLSCAKEISKHADPNLPALFPLLGHFTREMSPRFAFPWIEGKPTRIDDKTPHIRELLNDADVLSAELGTIYPTREKVRSRATKLSGLLWRLRLTVLGESKP